MTIYNFNLLVGYLPSGVDYAQGYRAEIFRQIGQESQFIFTDLPRQREIQFYINQIGLQESEIMSVHFSFLDNVSFISQLSFEQIKGFYPEIEQMDIKRHQSKEMHCYRDGHLLLGVTFVDEKSQIVEAVSIFAEGKLLKKDYYTNRRIYSHYYYPVKENERYTAYQFRTVFYNDDQEIVFEELRQNGNSVFHFGQEKRDLSKHDLIALFINNLRLSSKDWLILDRSSNFDFAQPVLMNKGPAKIAAVIHSEHYFPEHYDNSYLFLNYEYYYIIRNAKEVDYFLTATELQKKMLFQKILEESHVEAKIEVIPVGSLPEINQSLEIRKPYSIITASRLDTRKHIDWLIKAVVEAKKHVPQLTFHIYGNGRLEFELNQLIKELKAQDYILLKGHAHLEKIYPNYELYVSASTWETFGLTLLEATGAGLSMIGLDVPYGNRTFIDHKKNGYLVDYDHLKDSSFVISNLAKEIVTYFSLPEEQKIAFHKNSYCIAENYQHDSVKTIWNDFLKN